MEKEYNTNAYNIKDMLREIYLFAKLTFSKDLVQNLSEKRKNRLENKMYYPWENKGDKK